MDKLNVKRATLAEHGTIIYDLLRYLYRFTGVYLEAIFFETYNGLKRIIG